MKTIDFAKLRQFVETVDADKTLKDGEAEVFINCNGRLAVTWKYRKDEYCGYFLDLHTGEISYGD